jgi:hypothetical protein
MKMVIMMRMILESCQTKMVMMMSRILKKMMMMMSMVIPYPMRRPPISKAKFGRGYTWMYSMDSTQDPSTPTVFQQ